MTHATANGQTSERLLAGRRALVTGGDQVYGQALLAGLRNAGAEAESIALTDSSKQGVHAAFEAAVGPLGEVDAVIHAAFDPGLLEARPLLEISSADWETGCEASLRTALFVLQAAQLHLRARGGRIILVTPTLSTSGEAGLVPLATAAEAIRMLGKAAAKQWGRLGITVNNLAPPVEALRGNAGISRITIGEPAFPDYDALRDVGPVVSFLASDAAARLTAATLRVDGGVWTAG